MHQGTSALDVVYLVGAARILGKGDWDRLPRSGPKGALHKRCLSPLLPRSLVRPYLRAKPIAFKGLPSALTTCSCPLSREP
jgi:hypothetical protein